MKNTSDEKLREYLKENSLVKSQFRFGIFKGGKYEALIDDLFDRLATYPKEHGYTRLYEKFCRNIQTVKLSDDMLDTLDAQIFLVLNFESLFKLVLLSIGLITESELSEDKLVLSDCRDRLLAQLQKYQIIPEVMSEFEDNFNIVKGIRNNGAHKYMHDEQLKILKLVSNICSTLSGYLIVIYFKKVIETGLLLERQETVPALSSGDSYDQSKELVEQGKASEAISRATALATGGDREAQEYLAKVYANPPKDSGIKKDIQEAVKWNTKLANAGDVKAMHRLGDLYRVLKQYAMVVKCYKAAAQKGNVSSFVCLGNLYLTGVTGLGDHSIRQDLTKAKGYFEQAAAAGNQDAANKLKDIERRLRNASDTSPIPTVADDIAKTAKTDYEKALVCLSQKKLEDALCLMKDAALDEDEQAVLALRWLVKAYGGKYGMEKNPGEALKYLRMLAGKNDPEGLFQLGLHYRMEEKYSTYISWLRKSAALEYMSAFLNLGYIYDNGIQEGDVTHVKVNKAEAFKWYYKAAELGKPSAQYRVALMYEKGEGTSLDLALAVEWCRKSAEQGYQLAVDLLNEWKGKGLLEMPEDSLS